MGWSSFHKPQHRKATDELLDNLNFTSEDGSKSEVLAHAFVARREFYAVVKRTKPDGSVRHWLAVSLVQFSRGEYNMSVKDMSEEMGPYACRCPERLLDLIEKLVPVPEGDGAAFRARCRAYHAKRKSAPKVGQKVRFAESVRFTNGSQGEVFTLVKVGGKVLFMDAAGLNYRIRGWQQRNYEVVT